LEGNHGTVGAAIKGIIDGLNTHNAALVTAGAEVLHDNASDVASNNIPLNGGTYNADGQTIADALSTATGPLPPPPLTTLLAGIQSQTVGNQGNGNGAGDQPNPAGDTDNHMTHTVAAAVMRSSWLIMIRSSICLARTTNTLGAKPR
jgi:hypothetical protein